MRKFWMILGTALLFSCATAKKAPAPEGEVYPMGEQEITLATGAKGILSIASDQAAPLVVMYHGYASSKNEVGDMFLREAALLRERGIHSLRIGYRGWDGAPYGEEFLTVHTMMEDAQAALDFALALPQTKKDALGLLGFSMGGGVVQYIAGTNPEKVAGAATWSSSVEYGSIMKEEDKQTARREGTVTLDLGWRTILHSAEFADSLDAYRPLETFGAYANPLLVVDGTDDYLYPNTVLLEERRPDADMVIIPGADHIYRVLSEDQSLAEEAMEKTADWFAKLF